jgi:hypothetical protein
MNLGITVDLAGGRLQNPGLFPFGQSKHINGPHNRGLDCFYGIMLIMDGRGRTRKIIDLFNLTVKGMVTSCLMSSKKGLSNKVHNVLL